MRQSCDKTGPDDDEAHRGIPRDTNGDPIFLILPEGVRMKYQAGMTACEMAWREGESLAIAEAATLTHLYRQPMRRGSNRRSSSWLWCKGARTKLNAMRQTRFT